MNKDLILSGENTGMQIGSEVATISKAIVSDLVNNCNDSDVKNTLLVCITECYSDLKQPLPGLKDLQYTADKVLFNLRKYKKNLRIKEIQIAFSNGILKQYGEYYGLSVASFTMFISEYCKDQNRLEALFQLNTKPVSEEKPSFDDMFNFAKQNALNALICVRSKKEITTISTAVYDFLMYARYFRPTKEEIAVLMTSAAKEYEIRLRTERKKQSDNLKRKDYTKKIMDLYSNSDPGKIDSGVLTIAKKNYLIALFGKMVFADVKDSDFAAELEALKPNYFVYLEWLESERIRKAEAAEKERLDNLHKINNG